MFIGLLPPGVLEFLLFVLIVGAFVLVVRGVRRRASFAGTMGGRTTGDEQIPDLATEVRVQAIVRRIFRDTTQGEWVVEAAIGRRKFVFRPTDFTPERYQPLVNSKEDFVLYAFATLAPGGVEAMRDQIKDFDKVAVSEDLVRLVPAGQFANDYAVIGRVASSRDETLDGDPVAVYRTQVVRQDDLTLVLDLAVEAAPGAPRFGDGEMVHGSARLFGRLAV